MGLLDNPIRKLAQTVMRTFGTTAVVRQVIHGNYSTTSGTAVETTADTEVQGIFSEYSQREIGGSVLVGDRQFICAAADIDFVPTTEDRVRIGSVDYRVVSVTAPQATDEAAIFELQLRGTT